MSGIYLLEDSELRAWAYDPDSFKGIGQDIELAVATLQRSELVLECAADNNCPTQRFFVCCVYQIVGDALRSDLDYELEQKVLKFIRQAEKTGNEHMLEFVWRARQLIENPSEFDCEKWCYGVLARELFDKKI